MTAHAVVERNEPDTQAAVQHEQPGVSIMALVSQAVSAGLPMETIRELRTMAKEEAQEIAKRAFNAALKAAQEEMRPISTDATNSQTSSRYATYAKLDTALRPIYTKHGFSVSYDTGDGAPEGHVRILAYVTHDAGFSRTYHADMPNDGKGAKGGDVMTKTHATGAAMQYGMRYLLKMIFNVAIGEGDKDGNAPTRDEGWITEAQVKTILDLIDKTDTDIAAFCEALKIDAIPSIRPKDFQGAVDALKMKLARKRSEAGNA